MCVCVCPSIFAPSDRTGEPIETRVAPFDAPIRRNDDGIGPGSVSATCHVPRGAAKNCLKCIVSSAGQMVNGIGAPLAGHMPPTTNHYPLRFLSPRGAHRTCQGKTTFLIRDPLAPANVDLAAPNSAR